MKLVKLILVMPATKAVSERLFSYLKRIKTYLLSTTTNNRLIHLLILYIHKLQQQTDSLVRMLLTSLLTEEKGESKLGLY